MTLETWAAVKSHTMSTDIGHGLTHRLTPFYLEYNPLVPGFILIS